MPVALFAGFVFLAAMICMLLLRTLAIGRLREKSEAVVHTAATSQAKGAVRLPFWSYEKVGLVFALEKV